MAPRGEGRGRGRGRGRGNSGDGGGDVMGNPITPSPAGRLSLPGEGGPTLPPLSASPTRNISPARTSSPARSNASGNRRDSFPGETLRLPGGNTSASENWLSMKNPDSLSASERVIHHNLAIVGTRIDQLTQAIIRLAGAKVRFEQTDAVDEQAAAADQPHLDKLSAPEFDGILQDQMRIFKESEGDLTNRAGVRGKAQAAKWLEHLKAAAMQEAADKDASMDTGADAGEGEADEDNGQPFQTIAASASELSESGLWTWHLQCVTKAGVGPQKKGRSVDNRKKRARNNDDDDDDEDGEAAEGSPKKKVARKTRKDVAASRKVGENDSEVEEVEGLDDE